jgi:preprotein translocase subunit YajC
MLFLGIFFFSSRREKKQRKKNHREKKHVEKGGNFPSSSHSTLSLLAPALPSHFCPSVSNALCWHPFFLKKKKKKKKNHRKEKKMQREEGAYLQAFALPFHFWLSLLASCICLFVSSTFSLGIFFFSSRRKKEQHKDKKTIKKKKYIERGGSLHFFSRFYIWDKCSSCFLLSTFLQR